MGVENLIKDFLEGDNIETVNNHAPDLAELTAKLFSIKRFDHPRYPEGLFRDNVGSHTLRMVRFIQTEALVGIDTEKTARMLSIHDVPEIVMGDMIAPEKDKSEGQALYKDEQEMKIAHRLLSAADVDLLSEFNASTAFLKGYTDELENVTGEGLVASVLDKIDGNLHFHWAVTTWVERESNDGIPDDGALIYTFNQASLFLKQLMQVEAKWPDAVDICTKLINGQLTAVVRMWEAVSVDRLPDTVRQQIGILAMRHLFSEDRK